jgi:hypothetical protein
MTLVVQLFRIAVLVPTEDLPQQPLEVKVKFRGEALQHYSRTGLLYSYPKGVPSFISRGAAHQTAWATSASEGRNYRWNLANNLVIHVDC